MSSFNIKKNFNSSTINIEKEDSQKKSDLYPETLLNFKKICLRKNYIMIYVMMI